MSLFIEIPQCPICHEPFGQKTEIVRPDKCGHVICKPCSEMVMRRMKVKCPLNCQNSGSSAAYEPVFVSFGGHDVHALHKEEDICQKISDIKGTSVAELETVGHLLNEVARSAPEAEACTVTNTGRNNRGLIFLRAARLLHKIADGTHGDDCIKDFLHQVSAALGSLKEFYDSMIETIQNIASVRDKIGDMNASLRHELDSMAKRQQSNDARHKKELALQRAALAERESQLRADLNAMHEKLTSQLAHRMCAEDGKRRLEDEVEKWRRNSTNSRRKYELEKIKNERLRMEMDAMNSQSLHAELQQSDAQSDNSLEIETPEHDSSGSDSSSEDACDNSGMAPPSGSVSDLNTGPSSSYDSPIEASGMSIMQQTLSSIGSGSSSRKLERPQSAGTVKVTDEGATERADVLLGRPAVSNTTKGSFSRAQSCSRILPSRLRAPDSRTSAPRHKCKPGKVEKLLVDRDLLAICPNLAEDIATKGKATEDKARSTRKAKANATIVNPLAVRQLSQDIHAPQRKKQRLTLGMGDSES